MTNLLDTRRPRLVLALLCLLLWVPGFFTLPPGDRDESRFAQGTKQMLETGDFVRIMNGTEARNRKPIGIYWLQAPFVAAARAAGLATANPIWPYRLPSALGGLIAVLACFSVGERLLGRRTAMLGAGMLAASVVLATEVHIAKTDAALLGATSVVMALLGWAYREALPEAEPLSRRGERARAACFWLAMGAGILLKGPITPMVAGLAVLMLLAVERRAAWLRRLHAGWGVPLMVLVVAPWFVAIGFETHGRFFQEAVGGDLARKLTSGDDAHWGPPGLHALLLPVLLFPMTAALPRAVAATWRRRGDPAVRFLLAWIVPSWLVFEAVPTKLPHYPLPLYPAICLLLAGSVVGFGARHGESTWPPEVMQARPAWLDRLGGGLAGLLAAVLGVASIVLPVLLDLPWWLGLPGLLAAIFVGWFAVRVRMAVFTVIAAIPLYAAVLGWELPRLWPVWIAPRVVAMLPPGPMGAVGFAEPSLMFLAGTGTLWVRPPEAVEDLADGRVASLVVGDRDLAAVRAVAARQGLVLQVGGTVPGFNLSRGRRVLLTVMTR